MIRYFQRSVKYFISLSIIYFLVLYAMSMTSMMVMSPSDALAELFGSNSGLRMVAAMVVLSIAYPFFGFTKRSIDGNVVVHRDTIVDVMVMQGFKLIEEREGKLIFGASNFFRRITLLFEDHIVMTQLDGGKIELSGNRKSVAYMIFRLEYAIDNANKTATK